MKSSSRTKIFALSMAALFAAQPVTANITAMAKSYANGSIIQKAALPIALIGLGYYAQKGVSHVYSNYIFKQDGNDEGASYLAASNEIRKTPVNLMGDLAFQKYGYLNKFQKTAFTKGNDICNSISTLYQAYTLPEVSLDTAKQSLELSLLAVAGLASGWHSKHFDNTVYESLNDTIELPIANVALRKLYSIIGAKWQTTKKTGDAVLKLSQVSAKLFKAR